MSRRQKNQRPATRVRNADNDHFCVALPDNLRTSIDRMISIDISADTVEEAYEEGFRQLGVPSAAIETQVLSAAHEDCLPGAEPLPGVTVRLVVNEDMLLASAREHLNRILELMNVKCSIAVLRRRGGVVLNIHAGDDDSLVIGKNGQNLEALQILVNRMVVHGGRELLPIYVDCEDYMEKRLVRLESAARRGVKRAVRDSVEVPLEIMTAFERKIVHNVLKETRGIHTLSRGEGAERHIVIIPDESSANWQLQPHRGPMGRRSENPTPATGISTVWQSAGDPADDVDEVEKVKKH